MTPGRPRSAVADDAILEAALQILGDEGYARMSVEAVAVAAGVGKATVYRRYRDKADLATAAVASVKVFDQAPDSEDVRADLVAHLSAVRTHIERNGGMGMLGTLLVEEVHNPGLLALFRERVILPRRGVLRARLERAKTEGALRADLDAARTVDLLVGSYLSRHLSGEAFPPDWAEAVVGELWAGIAPAARVLSSSGLARRTPAPSRAS